MTSSTLNKKSWIAS